MENRIDSWITQAKDSFQGGVLYVVATPIGNLNDLSLRSIAAFLRADIVLAEDTRVTGQLMSHLGVHKKLVSVREHNEREMSSKVIDWLSQGLCIVQVSDAGTPGISDPGAKLASATLQAGYTVTPIPGPSAVITALSAAGLTTATFLFAGFLPPKSGARSKILLNWKSVDYAVVCYEAPHRIEDTLVDIVATLGPAHPLVLAREITKTFETFIHASAQDLLEIVRKDKNQQRGECVLIIDSVPAVQDESFELSADDLAVFKDMLATMPTKQAANTMAYFTKQPKKKLYDLALSLKN